MEVLYKNEEGRMLWRANLTDEEKAQPNKLPSADLSRTNHGKCVFRADKFAEHDGHAPSRFKSEADRAAYVQRVLTDLKLSLAAVSGWNKAGVVSACGSTLK